MESPKRILVIQLRRIGDCLLTTPLLRALRRHFPEAQIDFLAEHASRRVTEGNPHVDETLVYNKLNAASWLKIVRGRHYDWVLDGLSNPRSAVLTLASNARIRSGFSVPFWKFAYNVKVARPPLPEYASLSKLRLMNETINHLGGQIESENLLPEFYPTPEERDFAQKWLSVQNLGGAPLVILAPAHRRPVRRWNADGFGKLSKLLRRKTGARIFAAWGPGEEKTIEDVVKTSEGNVSSLPPTTLGQMGALLEKCSLMIANDNGPKHLGVAVGAKTLTLYGPTRPSDWNPPEELRHRIFRVKGLGCLGCNRNDCPYHHECMEWMSADEVFLIAQTMLC
jgi:ADP-heptose:LPS heptosyltransferase